MKDINEILIFYARIFLHSFEICTKKEYRLWMMNPLEYDILFEMGRLIRLTDSAQVQLNTVLSLKQVKLFEAIWLELLKRVP